MSSAVRLRLVGGHRVDREAGAAHADDGMPPEWERIMSRRRKRITILAALLVIGSGGAVMAGLRSNHPLEINLDGPYANAGLAETRNTPDATQFVECGSNPGAGFCTVRDLSGTYYSCYTFDPEKIAVIRSMSADSYISVSWDAATFECTYVLSYATSRSAVRQP